MTDKPSDDIRLLPDVSLTAAGSAREIALRDIGVPTVLVFHGQDNGGAALQVNKTLRKEYPAADQVFIASVIDLRSFPSMFHGMVRPALEKAYFNASGKLPEGADPAALVVLLPDWDGAVSDAVGMVDATRTAGVAVADAGGKVVCIDQSEKLDQAALAAIAGLS